MNRGASEFGAKFASKSDIVIGYKQPYRNDRIKPLENTSFIIINIRIKQGAIFIHELENNDSVVRAGEIACSHNYLKQVMASNESLLMHLIA
ncbi:hypothetical protein EMCG_05258 [[Emmonsia] crescens]|uniref:Uncharacterized protein n=1 Tax=[Emmonsia] crescens TaxID=73230 RepID=A0A0G2HPL4_9EURO|nr:hypothetical protein EMCG_05258 [Emmonsia crescens UAMH 3008]